MAAGAGADFDCGCTAGAGTPAFCAPRARSSRKRCARVEKAGEFDEVTGVAARPMVPVVPAGRLSSLVLAPRVPFAARAGISALPAIPPRARSPSSLRTTGRARPARSRTRPSGASEKRRERRSGLAGARGNLQLTTPGTARVKGAISARKLSPPARRMM